jgi:hypothetical protein
MINAKVKILNEDRSFQLEHSVNSFLQTIDVRQIIKTEYSIGISTGQYNTERLYSAIIYYVELADVRDSKIENVLEIK